MGMVVDALKGDVEDIGNHLCQLVTRALRTCPGMLSGPGALYSLTFLKAIVAASLPTGGHETVFE